MMKLDNTPLRMLVKTFVSGVIDREEYLAIRARLLQKLETSGQLSDKDLRQLLNSHDDQDQPVAPSSSYTPTDWLLILLGLGAAIGLAVIFYG